MTPLRIEVGGPEALATELEPAIADCVGQIAAALDLPLAAEPELTVSDAPALRITINGSRARAHHQRRALRLRPPSLAEIVAEAILAHAELLVTPDVVAALWEQRGGAGEPPEGFAALLGDVVRHWTRLGRVPAVDAWGEAEPGALLEAALCEASGPLRVIVDRETYAAVAPEWSESGELGIGASLFEALGIVVGEPVIEPADALPDCHFAIGINDLRTLPGPCLGPGEALVDDAPERLKLMNVLAEPARDPATYREAAVVSDEHADMLEAAGLTVRRRREYLRTALAAAARRHAPKLLSRDVVEYRLDSLSAAFPTLQAQVARIGGLDAFTRVLRLLLAEQVSTRDLVGIAEHIQGAPQLPRVGYGQIAVAPRPYRATLPGHGVADRDELELAETARMGQALSITALFSRHTGTLVVYVLDAAIEARLDDPAPLTDDEVDALLDAIAAEVGPLPQSASVPALLTSATARARLARTIRAAFPAVAVVSYPEVEPNVNVQPVARISL